MNYIFLKLIVRKIHIDILIIISFIIFLASCETGVERNLFISKSAIWVDGVIGTDDTVKIFLGTTSGMNSGDIAEFRDDATVNLYINNTTIPVLLTYKFELHAFSKGYYFYPRLGNVKPGDSLYFKASIDNSKFKPIEAKAFFPSPVLIEELNLKSVNNTYSNNRSVNLRIKLDSSSITDASKYLILTLRNLKYSAFDTIKKSPGIIETINSLNNISFSNGMSWNERLNSVLIDISHLKENVLPLSFTIDDLSVKNDLEIDLKTISKDYYLYCKALDNGDVGLTNVSNGAGIITGYSNSVKKVSIK